METKKNENKNALSHKEKERKVLTPEQIRKRKMMVAVPIMLVPFCLCMYWIFFSENAKEENREKVVNGMNVEIPEPKVAGIVDDKRKAYEQEEALAMQKSKMQSLDDYIDQLKINDKPETTDADSVAIIAKPEKPQNQNSIEKSAKAYQEATRQINSFYQEPKTEKTAEMRELERQVQDLKFSLNAQQDAGTQQLDVMEKGYQMAAKYLNPKEEKPAEKEIYSVPVGKVNAKTVSGLPQPQSDAEFIEAFSKERNYGFITAVGESFENTSQNTIKACIHDNQTLTDGSRVKLRLLEEMKAGNHYIPQHSLVFGIARLQGERLEIQIPTIEYRGNIIPVELSVYDTDGQKGIFIPGSMGLTAAKEALGNMGQSLGTSVSIAQDAKQQLVMDATKIGIQGVSQFLGKKFKEIKINLKAGYQILLAGPQTPKGGF